MKLKVSIGQIVRDFRTMFCPISPQSYRFVRFFVRTTLPYLFPALPHGFPTFPRGKRKKKRKRSRTTLSQLKTNYEAGWDFVSLKKKKLSSLFQYFVNSVLVYPPLSGAQKKNRGVDIFSVCSRLTSCLSHLSSCLLVFFPYPCLTRST